MSVSEAYRDRFFPVSHNPLVVWFREELVIDNNASVRCTAVWLSLEDWCRRTGNLVLIQEIPQPDKLTRQLREHIPGLACLYTWRKYRERGMRYAGIRFKDPNSRWAVWDD